MGEGTGLGLAIVFGFVEKHHGNKEPSKLSYFLSDRDFYHKRSILIQFTLTPNQTF